jgi:glycosyltransferase involved in cell wall biosynthesis
MPAVSEAVTHEHTGMLFQKGDIGSLADALEDLLTQPEKRLRLGRAARSYVLTNRTWAASTLRISEDLRALMTINQSDSGYESA